MRSNKFLSVALALAAGVVVWVSVQRGILPGNRRLGEPVAQAESRMGTPADALSATSTTGVASPSAASSRIDGEAAPSLFDLVKQCDHNAQIVFFSTYGRSEESLLDAVETIAEAPEDVCSSEAAADVVTPSSRSEQFTLSWRGLLRLLRLAGTLPTTLRKKFVIHVMICGRDGAAARDADPDARAAFLTGAAAMLSRESDPALLRILMGSMEYRVGSPCDIPTVAEVSARLAQDSSRPTEVRSDAARLLSFEAATWDDRSRRVLIDMMNAADMSEGSIAILNVAGSLADANARAGPRSEILEAMTGWLQRASPKEVETVAQSVGISFSSAYENNRGGLYDAILHGTLVERLGALCAVDDASIQLRTDECDALSQLVLGDAPTWMKERAMSGLMHAGEESVPGVVTFARKVIAAGGDPGLIQEARKVESMLDPSHRVPPGGR